MAEDSSATAPEALLACLEQALEARKARIDDEVKNYPRPITGCDVQFDYALEQQAGIRKELQRAAALRAKAARGDAFARELDELVHASAFLDAATAHELAASLAEPAGAPAD